MDTQPHAERLELAISTPAGPVSTTVELPQQFVPVTAIVPLVRHLGQAAQDLEREQARQANQPISCAKGCAACCRMLVPVSAPEAFALRASVSALPLARQAVFGRRLRETMDRLDAAGLLASLWQLAEADRPPSDEQLEPVNRAYYRLKLPCPFLEDEVCAIYEDRPSACRELWVTSPAAWCADLLNKPVHALSVPLRVSTVLALVWADLTSGPPRLIPLPLALDWADRHASENRSDWPAQHLVEQALNAIGRVLSQAAPR
jgi:hypothetical protein